MKRYDVDRDDAFLTVSMKVNQKQFNIELGKFLKANRDQDGELSPDEIEYLLESIAAWKQLFLSAYCQVKKDKELYELRFKQFIAKKEPEIRKQIYKDRTKELGKITSANASISKEELKNCTIRMFPDEYDTYEKNLIKLNNDYDLLKGTYDNLVQRAMELQSIFKRKIFQKEIV